MDTCRRVDEWKVDKWGEKGNEGEEDESLGRKKRLQPNVGQVLGNNWCAMPVVSPKRTISGPKIGIGDHLIAQKGDQRPQESAKGPECKDMLPNMGMGSQMLIALGDPGR